MAMSLTDEDKQWIREAVQELVDNSVRASEARMVSLITSVKDDLDGRMDSVSEQLGEVSTRLDRQGSWLRAGGRHLNHLNSWTEKVDRDLERKTLQIQDIRRRLKDLENPSK
jgi:hypothetical protein